MSELVTFLSTGVALSFCATLFLLSLGVNFVPNWAKSRPVLLVACALVVLGSGAMT